MLTKRQYWIKVQSTVIAREGLEDVYIFWVNDDVREPKFVMYCNVPEDVEDICLTRLFRTTLLGNLDKIQRDPDYPPLFTVTGEPAENERVWLTMYDVYEDDGANALIGHLNALLSP